MCDLNAKINKGVCLLRSPFLSLTYLGSYGPYNWNEECVSLRKKGYYIDCNLNNYLCFINTISNSLDLKFNRCKICLPIISYAESNIIIGVGSVLYYTYILCIILLKFPYQFKTLKKSFVSIPFFANPLFIELRYLWTYLFWI